MNKQLQVSQFFAAKKRSDIDPIDRKTETLNPATEFYQQCLKLPCNKATCCDMKSSLNNQITALKEKNSKAKDAIKICSAVIEKKDETIDRLSKALNGVTLNSLAAATVTTASKTTTESTSTIKNTLAMMKSTSAGAASVIENNTAEAESTILRQKMAITKQYTFSEHSCEFDEKQLSTLRSISIMPRDDSTFVAIVVKYLYKDRIDSLKTKSLTGRGKNKTMLTPEKVKIVGKLYEERINNLAIDDTERIKRLKKLNTLIKDAISNTNRANEVREVEKQISDNLSLM